MSTIWPTIVSSLHRLASARPGYALAALGLYAVSLFIGGARWRAFLRSIGGDVGVWRATLASVGGMAVSNLFPSGRLGGEACRIALVRQAGVVNWRQATIAAVWDRLSELPALFVLAVMAVVAVRDLGTRWRWLALAVVVVAAAAGGALALRGSRRPGRPASGWRERLELDKVNARTFAGAVGLSALLWLQDVLRLGCVSMAFGLALSPTKIATLSILTVVGGLLPSIGGLGPIEGGLVAGLVAFGVDVPTAAAVTATERLISYGFSTAAGAVVIALLGGRSIWRIARRRPGEVESAVP